MQLHDLLGDIDVLEQIGDPHVEIAAVTHDSRRTGPGACFCCIPGATSDGHDHAVDAVAAGAVALVVERALDLLVPQTRVASVRSAIGPLAACFERYPSRATRVLGVTGTNGKTTTTYLLEAIAGAAGERAGVIGTVGGRVAGEPVPGDLTTPEAPELQTLLARMRDAGVGIVAMEVSSHALDQFRVDGTWFSVACFTNLSHDHLDHHGTIDAYFEAKARLFDPARAASAAIGLDDSFGVELVRRAAHSLLPVRTFALDDPAADVRAEGLDLTSAGSRFVLADAVTGEQAAVRTPLISRFNVANALAAAATALAAGVPFEAVVAGLSSPVVVPGRLERVEAGQPFTVLVDYAHTPDALDRVLEAARSLVSGHRVIVVFGCGGDRDVEKRPLMGRAAGSGADFAVLTSDNPRSEDPAAIIDAVLPGLSATGARFTVELDRRAAIRLALADARAGDVVVLAGKGHETTQVAAGVTRPFDDRVVAREELGSLAWT